MIIVKDIKALAVGLWTTWKHICRPALTIQYPEEKRTPFPRYRARMVLTRDPDGEERCVACYLCSAACPVDCIHPKKDEANFAQAEMLYIDPVECIDCGACVPVCPVSAIFALDDLPEKWAEFTARNAAYYGK